MDEKRIFLLLKKAFMKLGLLADYVTEEIETSTYYIRKWKGGKVELFQEQAFSKPNVTNWTTYTSAGLYYGNFKITFPSVVKFSEAPRVYASPGKVGSNVGWVGPVTSTETTASMAIVRNGNSGDVVIKIHAIGIWGGVIYSLLQYLGGGNHAIVQSSKEYYSCYKQCKESNKEYKEQVLLHFEERGNGDNEYIVYGVHAERYPRRHLFGVGLHSRECWNHNDYECSNWYGRKLYEYCRRRWANYWAGRRWLPRVGNRGSFGRSRKFETCNIQILFRNDRLQREARSDQTDIEVWGCAA